MPKAARCPKAMPPPWCWHAAANRGWNACPRSAAKGQRLALTYADPASEGAMAALVACSALGRRRPPQGGRPIAADPESLSVLALAERLAASDIPC
jgi:two-component system response regulator FlrC